METMRLRAIQHPSRVERLLVAFALRSGLMPPEAYMVRDPSAMPAVFQAIIFQAVYKDRAWCCWKHDAQLWLLTGDMPLELSREHGAPVLNVQLYGEDGTMKDSGSWVGRDGTWCRDADQQSPATAAAQVPVATG